MYIYRYVHIYIYAHVNDMSTHVIDILGARWWHPMAPADPPDIGLGGPVSMCLGVSRDYTLYECICSIYTI